MLWFHTKPDGYLRQARAASDPGLVVKTQSCAQFAHGFLHHVLTGHYGEDTASSAHTAGLVLYRLCCKLQKRSQPGIRAILAVVRDEITIQYIASTAQEEGCPPNGGGPAVQLLFQLLDVLVLCCLDNMVTAEPLGGERPCILHGELYFRFKQMTRGRKWKSMDPLQMMAATHICSYGMREEALQQQSTSNKVVLRALPQWQSLMKLPGTTTTPTAAGGLLRRTKGSQGVAVQDVDGMQQWHAAGIKMASDSVVNDGIPVGARALHDAQQAVGQGVGEGGVHVQHTKQGLAHDGQGMGEEDDDMHTPEHALIAAVHTDGAATSGRQPLRSVQIGTRGRAPGSRTAVREDEGGPSMRASPPTIYCTPRLQLPTTTPRHARSISKQLEDVRLSLQGYLDLEVLPQEPSPTNSNPEMHLLEECGTPSHVQRH